MSEPKPDRWRDAQDVVNLFIAAGDAVDALRHVTADHTEGCSCNPCRVAALLIRALARME